MVAPPVCRLQAAATTAFSAAMAERGLGSVVAPEVLPHLSSMHVLTTKWVDGEVTWGSIY